MISPRSASCHAQTAEQKERERYARDSEVLRELEAAQVQRAVMTAQDQQASTFGSTTQYASTIEIVRTYEADPWRTS